MINIFSEFYEMCDERRSVKTFEQKEIDEQTLKQIINLVQTAPSAGNLQSYKIFILKNKEKIKQLANASNNQNFISNAPIILGFVALPVVAEQHYGQKSVTMYAIQDATIACTYAMLAATSLGLSSTWVGAFNEDQVRILLNINPTDIPVALLPIGYSDFKPLHPIRKPNNEIIQIM